jgi:DNA polymerase-1
LIVQIFFCQVSVKEAKNTVDLWYNDRKEVLRWQQKRKKEALEHGYVSTLLGRSRRFPDIFQGHSYYKGHIERAAINTPVQVLNLSNILMLHYAHRIS